MRNSMPTILTGSALMLAMMTAVTPAASQADSPAASQADDQTAYGDGYQAGNYGRIRFADNGATIVRAADDEEAGDAAEANAPIFPGDTLRTDRDQRVEVQLAGGTVVRMDGGGEVVFQSLPDPYASFQDNAVLVLRGGVLRISSQVKDKEEFRIDTDAASVYLLGDGEIRIEAGDRDGTRVASLRGVAEVVGEDGSVLVRGGTQTVVEPGDVPADPVAYRALAEDGFDRWCDARDAAYRSADVASRGEDYAPQDVPAEVRPYYGELSAYGSWTQVPDYGYVWYPRDVDAGWQPYADGHWAYGPAGYFWVGNEPWGWAPYHYGCWQWVARYGWCWIPGRVFAGAWVSWSWGSAYVGWAPLDFWGRPGWRGGARYHGAYDPHSWTFVDYGHIGHHNARRYAVPISRIGDDLGRANIVSRPPRVAPRELARSPQMRDRALREIARDRTSRIRPVVGDTVPGRRFLDVQDNLRHRAPAARERGGAPRIDAPRQGPRDTQGTSPRGTSPQRPAPPSGGGRYPRRYAQDPRTHDRATAPSGNARENVREFYDRMSRPRVTQEQPPSRGNAPSARTPRSQAPQPRYKAPQPRAQAPQPRYKAPQPRAQAPQPRYRPRPYRPRSPGTRRRSRVPRPRSPGTRRRNRAPRPRSPGIRHRSRARRRREARRSRRKGRRAESDRRLACPDTPLTRVPARAGGEGPPARLFR